MSLSIEIREAEQSDLPGILALFAQPDMDDGSVLQLDRAELILGHMSEYPFYKLYAALTEGRVIGAFALLEW
jgi:hypothetical protein